MAKSQKQPGLDDRHRNADGEIHVKRSDTLIKTLRKEYGDDFAPGVRGDMKLGNYLDRVGAETLSDVLKHRK
jgi:hypothetical protein